MEPARPLPKDCTNWVKQAEDAGLDCALGRALYACNRSKNTWPSKADAHVRSAKTPLEVMQSTRLETAQRWLAHWLRGGSIYALCYTSDAQRADFVRERSERDLSEADKLRKAIRRVRRRDRKEQRDGG